MIVDHVQQGIGTPAYMWTAPGMSYYSGSKPPRGFYLYNPAKGRAIVRQLGGVSFAIDVNDKVSEDSQVEAMASMWQSCGMNVHVSIEATTALLAKERAGDYQMSYATGGGYYDPYLSMASNSLPTIANLYGFSNPTVTKLIDESGATTNPVKLTKIWKQVYDQEALLAVNIAVSSSPNYYIFTNKLHGLSFIALAAIYDHAYLSSS